MFHSQTLLIACFYPLLRKYSFCIAQQVIFLPKTTHEQFANGSVTASPTFAPAGTPVMLTLAPARGYEPDMVLAFRTVDPQTPVALTQLPPGMLPHPNRRKNTESGD
jgi:hypothetical protein